MTIQQTMYKDTIIPLRTIQQYNVEQHMKMTQNSATKQHNQTTQNNAVIPGRTTELY